MSRRTHIKVRIPTPNKPEKTIYTKKELEERHRKRTQDILKEWEDESEPYPYEEGDQI